MALFLNGKQIDKEQVYADNTPMSASDSETIAEKFDGLNAELLPITSGSSTNTKNYIDSGLTNKLNKSALKYIVGTGQTDANGILTATAMGVAQLNYDHHIILAVQSSYNGTCVNVGQYNKNFYFVCTSASSLANPIANTTVTIRIIYMDKWWQ